MNRAETNFKRSFFVSRITSLVLTQRLYGKEGRLLECFYSKLKEVLFAAHPLR